MSEIKAGPELDLAVSAAMNVFYDKRRVQDCPKYSMDLNAAFAAAEEVGLFRPATPWLSLFAAVVPDGLAWYVANHEQWIETGEPRSCPTPALAICAAVLKLKESVDETA